MNVYLMYKDRDFSMQRPALPQEGVLIQDLEFTTLLHAMTRGDYFLADVTKNVILSDGEDLETIHYRQGILQDCIDHPATIREIYQLAIDAQENKRRNWLGLGMLSQRPSGILTGAIQLMQMLFGLLRKLRSIADQYAQDYPSEGFQAFFGMIQKDLDDDYFSQVEECLTRLGFRDGVLLSERLGPGNEGAEILLRKPGGGNWEWVKDIVSRVNPVLSFRIRHDDDAGGRALAELKDRGIELVANALAQSADHIDGFFEQLKTELAFYVACLNLHEQLTQMGAPVAFPQPVPVKERKLSFQGLYDVCLALTMKQNIVGNDVDANRKDLMIITGANQGGKSTFLRSFGLAQLMMQCGMYVPAETFAANLSVGLFTHYKRKEDATMKSGKLDEELSRMSAIVDWIKPNSIVLFNESFAATNEREGSEIARQIVTALLKRHIQVLFVTHLYPFARGFYDQKTENAIFLRAERQADGTRTFKLREGEPLQTSFGEDLYSQIFAEDKVMENINGAHAYPLAGNSADQIE